MKEIDILNDLSVKYYELLWAVETKHPNETRHETALRYIMERERSSNSARQANTANLPTKKQDVTN